MDLFVVASEAFLKNHYFVVDEMNLSAKPGFHRLHHEDELNALDAFRNGGNEKYEVIRGKPYDFFQAVIRKTV